MKLLTQQEATEIIDKAVVLVFKHRADKYRLGQAICNLLPKHLYLYINGIEYMDFFHVRDDNKAVDMFYQYCVEELV